MRTLVIGARDVLEAFLSRSVPLKRANEEYDLDLDVAAVHVHAFDFLRALW